MDIKLSFVSRRLNKAAALAAVQLLSGNHSISSLQLVESTPCRAQSPAQIEKEEILIFGSASSQK